MHNIHDAHCKNMVLHRIRHVNTDIVDLQLIYDYCADFITHSIKYVSRSV